jgi:hypothetical protein
MDEKHEHEQYFFDAPTLAHLAGYVARYDNPCCVCAPALGQELESRGVHVTTLDIDERFATLRGFRRFDLEKPDWLGERFGLIVCDPPFYGVSLSRLFRTLRMLSLYNYEQPLLVSYLVRREAKFRAVFAPFHLGATGFRPGYQTVEKVPRNEIEFYGNVQLPLDQTTLDTATR